MSESKRRLSDDIQPVLRECEKRRKSVETEHEKMKRLHAIEKNKLKESKRQREYQKRSLKQASDVAKIAEEKLEYATQTLEENLKRLESQKNLHTQTIAKREASELKKCRWLKSSNRSSENGKILRKF